MKTLSLLVVLSLSLLFSPLAFAFADEHHGMDAPEKLGTVSFPTSCAAGVQKAFERGIALMHSFVYEDAGSQFRQIEQQDAGCAMAYWGEALSLWHQLWSRPTKADLAQGWELIQKAQNSNARTQRERDYIHALAAFYRDSDKQDHEQRAEAYSEQMKKVYQSYPSDSEAAIFYALSLMASAKDENQIAHDREAIAILSRLFEQQPDHPGVAHYLIHAADNPQLAQEGLAAARSYAGIASSSPHALHMPSHIFARLGLWQDDIRSNLAAIGAARKMSPNFAHMEHHRIHSMDFLEYAYLQIGDDAGAKATVEELEAINKADVEAEFQSYFDSMRTGFPARYALETRNWKDALALQAPAEIEPYDAGNTYWAHAVAAGHLRDSAAAHKAVAKYDELVAATKKSDKPYMGSALKSNGDEAHAWMDFADGKNEEALALLRGVAQKQDSIGKGEVEIPAREMLADMLMEMARPQEALLEYEKSLHTDPNRFNGLYGAARAAELTKQPQKAAAYYSQLLKNCGNGAHSDRPELTRARTQVASAGD